MLPVSSSPTTQAAQPVNLKYQYKNIEILNYLIIDIKILDIEILDIEILKNKY